MNKLILFFILAALVSSCTLAPKYERPEAPIAKDWQQVKKPKSSKNQEEQTPIAQIKWQDFFQSEEMQRIIQAALDNNKDLRIAILNIETAQANYQISRANLLPKVQASASQTKQGITENLSTTGNSYNSTRYDANIGATAFEVDLFGKNQSLKKSAFANYLATSEGKKSAQISLIAATANAYLQLLADQEIVDLLKNNLDAEEKSFALVKKAHEVGTKSRLDINRALTTLQNARSNLAAYQSIVTQDINSLQLLIGDPEFKLSQDKNNLGKIKLMENLPIQLPSQVLLERPDVKQSEQQLIAANANIGAARAAFFPTISLTGSFGFASDELKGLFSAGSAGAWSFTPQVSIPIFESGKNFANLKIANTNKEIAVANYEKTIQTAFREVSDELAKKQSLKEQLLAQEESLQAAKSSYKIGTLRHKSGLDNLTTKFEYEKAFISASQNTIEARRKSLENLVNLYKVLGGGQNQESEN